MFIEGTAALQTDGSLSIYFTGASFQFYPHEPHPVAENKNS